MVSYCELPVERQQTVIRRTNKVDMMHFLIVYIVAIILITWPKGN